MKFLYLFLFIFMFSFVSAGLNIGYDLEDNVDNVVLVVPEATTNYSTNTTNIYNNYSVNGSDLSLNNLSDVQTPSPSDGQSLVWDNSLMKWIAEFVISRWDVDLSNGYLYNNSDTLYFNESKLNNTIDSRAAGVETDFHIFINGSSYNNINHNITAGDADNVEFTIIPGKKFIFGDTFT